jgi:hypothetical protein
MSDKHLRRKTTIITVDRSEGLYRTNRSAMNSNIIHHNGNNDIQSNIQNNGVVVQPKNKFVAVSKNRLIRDEPIREKQNVKYISKDLDSSQKRLIRSIQNSAVGRSILILGNGPSLNQIDTAKCSEIPNLDICTINVPDKRCWPTKYWAFYDISQYNMHRELYNEFSGTIFNSTTIRGDNQRAIKFKHIQGVGYSRNAVDGIYVGMSSVYATIQISMYMRFDHIYVAGCDMSQSVDKNNTHFYGVNPRVKPVTRIERFKKEANWYNHMSSVLNEDERGRITFCSKGINPWGFINSFNSIEPQNTLNLLYDKLS